VNIDVLIVNVNLDLETTDGCEAIRARLAELRDDLTYEIVHWRAPNLAARAAAARGVLLGPNETPFPAYPDDFQSLLAWVRDQPGPLLGICGGHQVLALAHGATVGPVHDVSPATATYAGMPKVSGPTGARIVSADGLTQGLPTEFQVASSHVDEVKNVPTNFHLVLEGEVSRVQLIAHDHLPIWGAQFHPERPAPGDHGTALLERWLEAI
jgi:GMP synthase-like glutamine amidotransferase